MESLVITSTTSTCTLSVRKVSYSTALYSTSTSSVQCGYASVAILHNTYSMYEYSTSTLSPTTVHVRPASSPIQTDLLEVSQRILCCIHFQRFRKVTRRQRYQHVSEGFTKSTFHAMQVHADIKESGWDCFWVFVGVSRMGRDGSGDQEKRVR
jgi:hypothetical protein